MIDAMSPSALAEMLGPLVAFDVRAELGRILVPTQVVVGTRDVLTPPRRARILADGLADARLTQLAGCGHMVMLERPNELADAIGRCAPAEHPRPSGSEWSTTTIGPWLRPCRAAGRARSCGLGLRPLPLSEGRTQVVFGSGDPTPTSCSWRGPGREEDLAGEPFVVAPASCSTG